MTLQQLRYFVETCRRGSFAAAADALFLAQPSVADQVRRLEGELGATLFVRAGRGLRMTDAGRALQPEAEAVLDAVDRAAAVVADVGELREGTASFGTFNTARHYMVSSIIEEFSRRHPKVAIRLIGQNSMEVSELIRAGDLEAGLVTLPLDTTGLEVDPVSKDENYVVGRGEPPDLASIDIETLARMSLIVYDARFGWRTATRFQLAERAREAGLSLSAAIEVEGCDHAVELAARGLGVTIVTKAVCDGPEFPELWIRPLDPPLFDSYAFVWRKGAKLSRPTKALLSITRTHLQQDG